MYKVIKLSVPLKVNGEEIYEINVREPKVRDRLIAERTTGGEAQKELTFIANLCNMAPDDMMEMNLSDYVVLQETVNDFLS